MESDTPSLGSTWGVRFFTWSADPADTWLPQPEADTRRKGHLDACVDLKGAMRHWGLKLCSQHENYVPNIHAAMLC